MMMPKKLYRKLRGRLYEYGVTLHQAAGYIGRSNGYMTDRMNGTRAFDMDDVYQLCRLLEIETKDIRVYFPEGGKETSL